MTERAPNVKKQFKDAKNESWCFVWRLAATVHIKKVKAQPQAPAHTAKPQNT